MSFMWIREGGEGEGGEGGESEERTRQQRKERFDEPSVCLGEAKRLCRDLGASAATLQTPLCFEY